MHLVSAGSPTPTQVQFGERLESKQPHGRGTSPVTTVRHLNLEAKQLSKFPNVPASSLPFLVKVDVRHN